MRHLRSKYEHKPRGAVTGMSKNRLGCGLSHSSVLCIVSWALRPGRPARGPGVGTGYSEPAQVTDQP